MDYNTNQTVLRGGMNMISMVLVLFNLAVFISGILIVYEGIMIKMDFDKSKDLKKRIDRMYTYAIILAVALGLNLIGSLGKMMQTRRY